MVEAVQAGVTGLARGDLSFGLPDRRRVTGLWTEGRLEDETRRSVMSADDNDGESGNGSDSGAGVESKVLTKTKRPSMYRVLILNDDYTPMEFVVHILDAFLQQGA